MLFDVIRIRDGPLFFANGGGGAKKKKIVQGELWEKTEHVLSNIAVQFLKLKKLLHKLPPTKKKKSCRT